MDLNLAGIATGAANTLASTVYPILWTAVIAVFIILVVWILQHKHTIVYRVLSKNGVGKPYKDRAKEVKVDGVVFWKLLKKKVIIPVPPAETLTDVGKRKPKFYCEMIYSEEYGFIPLTFDINTENIIEKTKVINSKGQALTGTHLPFTPQQRSLLIGQLRKAEARKTKDMWDRITQLAVPMIMVMLIIVILLFWEDIAKPAKDMAGQAKNMQEQNLKITKELGIVTNNLARVTNELTGADIPIDQTIEELPNE